MKKIIIWTISVIAALYLLAEIIFPFVIIHLLLDKKVTYSSIYKAEDSGLPTPDTLHLISKDNLKLVAYKVVPNEPKAVIICLTGIENPSVTSYWGHAKMFYDANYASILLEVRGHAPSDGDKICAGYQETRDVKAVTDYIKQNSELKDLPIVIMGLSMGGAIAINSIGSNPDIDALISTSAFSSFEDVFVEFMDGHLPKVFTWCIKPFVKFAALIKYGSNPCKMSPKRAITRLNNRPALLMHTTEDSNVRYANFVRITKNAPKYVKTMTRNIDEHFFTTDFWTPQNDTIYTNTLMNFISSAVKNK